jgi:hypothetical protein
MRILILALTFGLGLTLNGKAENSIAKTDSIHFIDGVLIMANDTISLDEFIVFSERMSGQSTPSKNDEALVRYIRQAKKEMTYAENPELDKEDREKRIKNDGFLGATLGVAIAASGFNFQIIETIVDSPGSFSFYSQADLDRLTRGATGGAKMIGGALVAATSLGGTAFRLNKNKIAPVMSSAYHTLEANQLIDKAVNSYNKRVVAKAVSPSTAASLSTAVSSSTFGQTKATEMTAFPRFGIAAGSKVYMGGRPITLFKAKKMSIKSSPEAYAHFKKARGGFLDSYLTTVGVLYIGGGGMLIAAFDDYGSLVAVATLGTVVGILRGRYLRQVKRNQQIIMGVKAYNKAIAE